MPITLSRATLVVHKIEGYNSPSVQGKCDKCGWDAYKDAAIMTTDISICRVFHVCGNCGNVTDVLVANITDMPCIPIILPDVTSNLSTREIQNL